MNDAALAAAKRLAGAGIDSARLDARLLWQHAGDDAAAFETAIARRLIIDPGRVHPDRRQIPDPDDRRDDGQDGKKATHRAPFPCNPSRREKRDPPAG